MPTSTFFHLQEGKKEKIINAIKDELSRVSFDEASINQIVHAAEIPRGSFYQYFIDKDDMLGFILLDYRKMLIKEIRSKLRSNNGNIFITFSDIVDFIFEVAGEEKANRFLKNMLADIKVNSNFYLEMTRDASGQQIIEELKPDINFDMLDLHTEEDFIDMLEILLATCRDATAEVFLDISESKKAKQKYKNKLELLKRGFIKNQEKN
jgi:AcrR family transcriptional regulator